MTLRPHLAFDGNCDEGFALYAKVLKGKITFAMKFGDSPMADRTPPEWRDKIMHISLAVGDQILQGADAPPEHYKKPQGISVSLELSDPAEAERIFHALAEGGSITMPIQQTFWAAGFGMCTDRFGIPWMINCAQAV